MPAVGYLSLYSELYISRAIFNVHRFALHIDILDLDLGELSRIYLGVGTNENINIAIDVPAKNLPFNLPLLVMIWKSEIQAIARPVKVIIRYRITKAIM